MPRFYPLLVVFVILFGRGSGRTDFGAVPRKARSRASIRRKAFLKQAEWKEKAIKELDMAEQSRQAGNEGRARVCARRAAGHIAGEYLRRRGVEVTGQSAYVVIQFVEGQPEISTGARQVLQHLLMRLEPDHRLPVQADLIAEVYTLARELLDEQLKPA